MIRSQGKVVTRRYFVEDLVLNPVVSGHWLMCRYRFGGCYFDDAMMRVLASSCC